MPTGTPCPEAPGVPRQQQVSFSRAAELESELELSGAEPPAAGRWLLQAQAPAENEPELVAASRQSGGAGSRLRWFTTTILCASFLGLVRAGAGTLPGRGMSRRPAENVVSPPLLAKCVTLGAFTCLSLSFVIWKMGRILFLEGYCQVQN